MQISKFIVDSCCSIKGGFRILNRISLFYPRFQKWPISMPASENVFLQADLRNNVFFPLIKYGAYLHQVTEDLIISTFLKKGDCVVDVGANVGYVSALCAEYVGDSGLVLSIEPSRVTFKYLKQLNEQLPQIFPIQYAVSDKFENVLFIDEKMTDRSHVNYENNGRGYQVDSITIDCLLSYNNITKVDFIKIDTEGYDYKVIKGAIGTIRDCYPVVEFEAESDNEFADIYELLMGIGSLCIYKIYRVNNKYPMSLLARSKMTNNYFAIPENRDVDIPKFLFERGYLVPRWIDA